MTNETRRPPRPPRNPSAVDSRRRGERWVEQTIGRLLATTHHDYNVEAIADDLHTGPAHGRSCSTSTTRSCAPRSPLTSCHRSTRPKCSTTSSGCLTSPGRFEIQVRVDASTRYPPRLANRVLREVGSRRFCPTIPGRKSHDHHRLRTATRRVSIYSRHSGAASASSRMTSRGTADGPPRTDRYAAA